MSDSRKDKELRSKTQKTKKSDNDDTKALNLRPLPQGRPIAENTREDTDALMGYLD